jgi:hypothetical protein
MSIRERDVANSKVYENFGKGVRFASDIRLTFSVHPIVSSGCERALGSPQRVRRKGNYRCRQGFTV